VCHHHRLNGERESNFFQSSPLLCLFVKMTNGYWRTVDYSKCDHVSTTVITWLLHVSTFYSSSGYNLFTGVLLGQINTSCFLVCRYVNWVTPTHHKSVRIHLLLSLDEDKNIHEYHLLNYLRAIWIHVELHYNFLFWIRFVLYCGPFHW
jgi:hypothetical protein